MKFILCSHHKSSLLQLNNQHTTLQEEVYILIVFLQLKILHTVFKCLLEKKNDKILRIYSKLECMNRVQHFPNILWEDSNYRCLVPIRSTQLSQDLQPASGPLLSFHMVHTFWDIHTFWQVANASNPESCI